MGRLTNLLWVIVAVAAFAATYNTVVTLTRDRSLYDLEYDEGDAVHVARRSVKQPDNKLSSTGNRPDRGERMIGVKPGGGGERPGGESTEATQSTEPTGSTGTTGTMKWLKAVVKRPANYSTGQKKKKRMYHTAMTCNESPYTKWQSRIMYFYYKKAQEEGGEDNEMGGFTRVLHSGRPDNLMDEIPTYVVKPLPPGADMVSWTETRYLRCLANHLVQTWRVEVYL